MSRKVVLFLAGLFYRCFVFCQDAPITTRAEILFWECGKDTFFTETADFKDYKTLKLIYNPTPNSPEYNSDCKLPDDIEKLKLLDSLIIDGNVSLSDGLSSLPNLTYVYNKSYTYIPKLPALQNIGYASFADSFPLNLKESKNLKVYDHLSSGNVAISFDQLTEQTSYKPFNWYNYFSNIAGFKKLQSINIERQRNEFNWNESPDDSLIFPKAFFELKDLQHLSFKRVYMDSFPSDFSKFSRLHYLMIDGYRYLSPEVFKLPLDTLIGGLALKFEDSNVRMEKLQMLSCSGNHLPMLPNIIHLCYFGSELPKEFSTNSAIDTLEITITNGSSDAERIEHFKKAVVSASNLKSLLSFSITFYMMDDQSVQPLIDVAPVIKSMQGLKSFKVHGKELSPKAKTKLYGAYKQQGIHFEYIEHYY